MNDAGVLVVGYGNPLRGDDGFGCCAARLLDANPRLTAATVVTRHQLTPELAADIASASLVVLVDASVVDGAPGSVAVRSIQPRRNSPLSWSHHLDPAALAGLAHALYGHVPPIVLISVAGAAFAHSDQLSPALQRVLPEVVDRVVRVVQEHRG